jgi:hypothetical protein
MQPPSSGSKNTFNGLLGIKSQKIEIFLITSARTSNPEQSVSCCWVPLAYLQDALYTANLMADESWKDAMNGEKKGRSRKWVHLLLKKFRKIRFLGLSKSTETLGQDILSNVIIREQQIF